jgi:hypothetical protein
MYASLFFAAIGLILGNYSIQYPAFTNLSPDYGITSDFWFPMFPVLFITVGLRSVLRLPCVYCLRDYQQAAGPGK